MSRRAWGWLGLGVVALVGGITLWGLDGLHPIAPVVGVILCVVGLGLVAWVALGRRVALIGDAEGFTYRSWRGTHRIPWNRLSSLQFKNRGGSYYATDMIVVNDMGRKQMQVPLDGFDRSALHTWVETLPARASGKENLLD